VEGGDRESIVCRQVGKLGMFLEVVLHEGTAGYHLIVILSCIFQGMPNQSPAQTPPSKIPGDVGMLEVEETLTLLFIFQDAPTIFRGRLKAVLLGIVFNVRVRTHLLLPELFEVKEFTNFTLSLPSNARGIQKMGPVRSLKLGSPG